MKNHSFKGFTALISALLMLAAACFTACGADDAKKSEGAGLNIVATVFPEYDWVMNILGDNPAGAKVTMLMDSGVDMHSFQPSAEDILKIAECDLFIYVGGESDRWVKDALAEAANKEITAISLMEVLKDAVKEEELIEGMQEDHDHGEAGEHEADHDDSGHDHGEGQDNDEDHDHEDDQVHDDDGHSDDGADKVEYDEHVWLSLKNAAVCAESISEALSALDPANAAVYKKNADAYIESLSELDGRYRAAVSEAKTSTLLFGDRFPFRYMADDYGITCFAAFPGCSAETEASFETITFLAQKIDELDLHCVIIIEGFENRIAQTIVQNTLEKNQQIFTLDSMQATTQKDADEGATYLSIMEKNLSVLKDALK